MAGGGGDSRESHEPGVGGASSGAAQIAVAENAQLRAQLHPVGIGQGLLDAQQRRRKRRLAAVGAGGHLGVLALIVEQPELEEAAATEEATEAAAAAEKTEEKKDETAAKKAKEVASSPGVEEIEEAAGGVQQSPMGAAAVEAAVAAGVAKAEALHAGEVEAAVAAGVATAEALRMVHAAAVEEAEQEHSRRRLELLGQLRQAEKELHPLQSIHRGRSDREVALEQRVDAMTLSQLRKECESNGISTLVINKEGQAVEVRSDHLQRKLLLHFAGSVQLDGGIGSRAAAADAVAEAMGKLPAQLSSVRRNVGLAFRTAYGNGFSYWPSQLLANLSLSL